MAALAVAPAWDLLFVLPNVNIPRPSPFNGGIVRLLAGDDPSLPGLLRPTPANATGLAMLRSFRGQFGRVYVPGCLILDSDAPERAKTSEALRAFRNVCAIATILRSFADGPYAPQFSDHFDLYPLEPGNDGNIVAVNGIVGGTDDAEGFAGQCSPHIQVPWNFTCQPYGRVLARLIGAWQRCFLRRRNRPGLLRCFRALEIAVHACRYPTDSLMSLHDAGVRLVLWVSAFEVLLHPGGQRVDLPVVLTAIRSLPWEDKRLGHRRYRTQYRRQPLHMTVPEAIYYDLYMARNDFAHGNPTLRRVLRFRKTARRGTLAELAPLIFRPLLEHRLDVLLPERKRRPPPNATARWLLTKAGRQYMRDRAREWGDRPQAEAILLAKTSRRP
jgi:hypothetical protein